MEIARYVNSIERIQPQAVPAQLLLENDGQQQSQHVNSIERNQPQQQYNALQQSQYLNLNQFQSVLDNINTLSRSKMLDIGKQFNIKALNKRGVLQPYHKLSDEILRKEIPKAILSPQIMDHEANKEYARQHHIPDWHRTKKEELALLVKQHKANPNPPQSSHKRKKEQKRVTQIKKQRTKSNNQQLSAISNAPPRIELKEEKEEKVFEPEFILNKQNSFEASGNLIESAFKKFFRVYEIQNKNAYGFDDFLKWIESAYKQILTTCLRDLKAFKFNCNMIITMKNGDKYDEFHIKSNSHTVVNNININKIIKQTYDEIHANFETLKTKGSGWTFEFAESMQLNISKYVPFAIGSWIPLPQPLSSKKGITNVMNDGDECIKYAIAAVDHYAEINDSHRTEVSQYRNYLNDYNWEGITFPMTIEQLPKFEQQNNKSINVLIYDEEENLFLPHYQTTLKVPYDQTVWLLLINQYFFSEQDIETFKQFIPASMGKKIAKNCLPSIGTMKSHFIGIHNLSAFLPKTKNRGFRFVCNKCLYSTQNEALLNEHNNNCLQDLSQIFEMPIGEDETDDETDKIISHKNNFIKFTKYGNKQRVPLVIYADMESLLPQLELSNKRTEKTAEHKPFSIGVYLKGPTLEMCRRVKIHLDFNVLETLADKLRNAENELDSQNISQCVMHKFLMNCAEIQDFYIAILKQNDEYKQYSSNSFENDRLNMYRTILESQDHISNDDYINANQKMRSLIREVQDKNLTWRDRMTEDEKKEYREATLCHICEEPFDDTQLKLKKVCDRDPVLGQYRGAAHCECNLRFNLKNAGGKKYRIPVVFHNGAHYDWHALVSSLGDYIAKYHLTVKVVANDMQSYKMIDLVNDGKNHDSEEEQKDEKDMKEQTPMSSLQFIDSFNHLAESLDSLVDQLTERKSDKDIREKMKKKNLKGEATFKLLRAQSDQNTKKLIQSKLKNFLFEFEEFKDNEELIDLLAQKGIMFYKYMDNPAKFKETKLPPQELLVNDLNGETCSDEDYARANRVFNLAKCPTLLDYYNLYLRQDVVLLADVFENYRELLIAQYKLDPANYITVQSLSWDAAFLYNKDQVELITDYHSYTNYEGGIRGGISMIAKHLSVANHPRVPGYDEKQKHKYIVYLDENNLYGKCLSEPLPYSNIQEINPSDLGELKQAEAFIKNYQIIEDVHGLSDGFDLIVDLTIPPEVQDKTIDYPLCVENKLVADEDLSPLSKYHKEKFNVSSGKVKKLIGDFKPKKNYMCNIRTLQFYLNMGVQLDKIHSVTSYKQKAFLKRYVLNNQRLRKECKTDFEKSLYKMLNNAPYGKTMENVRDYVHFDLVNTNVQPEKIPKLTKTNNFKRYQIFSENFVGIERSYKTVRLNKPIQVGFVVLELSKLVMYKFHYDIIKARYGDRAQLLLTDTDSLVYEIETEDLDKDMMEMKEHFDFSNYDEDHPMYSLHNQGIMGVMKNDCAKNGHIHKVAAIKSKNYAPLFADGKEKKILKGAKKCVVKKCLHYQDFENTVLLGLSTHITQTTLRSFNHHVYTIRQTKMAMNPFDDKRYQLDGIHTVPYGYYKIAEKQQQINVNAIVSDYETRQIMNMEIN